MGAFKSTKTFNAPASLIPGIADEINSVFSSEGYEVKTDALIGGSYNISITKGGAFKMAMGLKMALKVDIQPRDSAIFLVADAGIFGHHTIATVGGLFFAWPLLLTQTWGLVKQAKLDDKVVAIVEAYIARKSQWGGASALAQATPAGTFCTSCGKPQTVEAKFCGHCGAKH